MAVKRLRLTWRIAWDMDRDIFMYAAPLRKIVFTEKYAFTVFNIQ